MEVLVTVGIIRNAKIIIDMMMFLEALTSRLKSFTTDQKAMISTTKMIGMMKTSTDFT